MVFVSFDVNYFAVFVSAVVGFIISWLWWGPLFGKQWIKYSGVNAAQAKKMHKQGMGRKMFIAFIAQLIMAFVLVNILSATGETTIMAGIVAGFWIWLGFVATIGVGLVLWNGKPWGLFWLNNLGWLVTIAIMGAILAVWG